MDRTQTYDERLPVPGLVTRVRTVWIQQTGPQPVLQRNLPTGGVEIQCLLGGEVRVVGPLTTAQVQLLPAHATIVGARFWPGAAPSLLGLPADELVDRVVPLADLPGGAPYLQAVVADTPVPEVALDVLQRELIGWQLRSVPPDPLVAEAVRRLMPWQPVEIGPLTKDLAISESQLRRRFLAEVGTGPKALQRTLRLQGYLALAQASSQGIRVADLAAEVRYADHAHLSRECLRLTGLTPRELLGGAEDRCGCGHDHAASYGPFLAGRFRDDALPADRRLLGTAGRSFRSSPGPGGFVASGRA